MAAKRNRLNRALWIVAGLLAVELLFSSAKIVVPKEKLEGAGGAPRPLRGRGDRDHRDALK